MSAPGAQSGQSAARTDAAPTAPRLHIGLTGGIAAGKSTVARVFEARGAIIVDADRIARQVTAAGTEGLAAIREAFGDRVITAEGELDRPAMAEIVFGDPRQRERLDAIVHPRVRAAGRRVVEQAGPEAVVVQDVPLLVETGQADAFDLVVVVEAPHAERVRRMVEERDMSAEEAQSRISAQATDAQRRAAADVVIVNDASRERLVRAAHRVWDRFVAGREDGHDGRADA